MPLTATTPRNNDSIQTYDSMLVYPLLATDTINTGDILIWDATNETVRTPANQADMATYVGIAEQTNPITSNLDETTAGNVIGPLGLSMLVRETGLVYFFATAGDAYDFGTPVYFNETASVQTITSSTNSAARTVAVGVIWASQQAIMYGPPGQWKVASAVAGSMVLVRLTAKYPVNANGSHVD